MNNLGYRWRGPRREWMVGLMVLSGLVIGLTGCDPAASPNPSRQGQLPPERVMNMPTDENIMRVAAFYDPYNPWIMSEDRAAPRGLKVDALYLGNPQGSGVFGEGIIHPKLYVLEKTEEGGVNPRLVKEWRFNPHQAMPYRAKKRTVMGWGYSLLLTWGELDLSGKEIRLIISFERPDGMILHSGKKDFRVPKTGALP